MKVKQTIIWEVDTDNIYAAQDLIMDEFKMPLRTSPTMESYDFVEEQD